MIGTAYAGSGYSICSYAHDDFADDDRNLPACMHVKMMLQVNGGLAH
jgi:hypothetical protein